MLHVRSKQNFIQAQMKDLGRAQTRKLCYCFLGDGCLLHKVYLLTAFTKYELHEYGTSKWGPPPLFLKIYTWYHICNYDVTNVIIIVLIYL